MFSGKDFKKEETTTFTVVIDDTSTPANPPAPAPAPAPTPTNDTSSSSCVDNTTFKYKGTNSNNCEWLGDEKKG